MCFFFSSQAQLCNKLIYYASTAMAHFVWVTFNKQRCGTGGKKMRGGFIKRNSSLFLRSCSDNLEANRQTACFKLATHSSSGVHRARGFQLLWLSDWLKQGCIISICSSGSRSAAPYWCREGKAPRWQTESCHVTFLFTCVLCHTTSILCIQTWMCFEACCHSNMYGFRLKGA